MIDQALHILKILSPTTFELNGSNLEFVIRKIARAEETNPFGQQDLKIMNLWLEEIERILSQCDDSQFKRLNFLKQLLCYSITAIENAFQLRLNFLHHSQIDKLSDWEQELLNLDKSPSEILSLKLKIAKACHDLYWDFHSPLNLMIDFGNFIDLYQNTFQTIANSTQSNLTLKIKTLETMSAWIENYAKGDTYRRLILNHDQIAKSLKSHKLRYLKKQQKLNQQLRLNSHLKLPKLLIVGAGPGGLIRTLAGLIKGMDVKVIEKRKRFSTRTNIIKLRQHPLLDYLGVIPDLLLTKKVYVFNFLYVEIGLLQKVLYKLIQKMRLPKSVINTESCLTDIKQFHGRCAVLTTSNNEKKYFHPNLIVDASGRHAIVAELVGNKADILSTTNVMVGGVFKNLKPGHEVVTELIKPTKALKQLSLPTPTRWCELVLPDIDTQQKLMEMDLQIENQSLSLYQKKHLQHQQKAILEEIVIQAVADDPYLNHDQPISKISLVDAWKFDIILRRRLPFIRIGDCIIQQSGDALVVSDPLAALGCNMTIRGVAAFSASLEIDFKCESQIINSCELYKYASLIQIEWVLDRSLKVRN